MTGADLVIARGTVLRFSQQQNRDAYVNSLPAGFVHVDVSRESFADFAARNLEGHPDRDALLAGRYVGLNIWRVLTQPPQDLPLAVCAANSVTEADRVTGEARVDGVGIEEFRFGSSLYHAEPAPPLVLLSRHEPGRGADLQAVRHRRSGHRRLSPTSPSPIPSAENPIPRASAEIRAFAYWRG